MKINQSKRKKSVLNSGPDMDSYIRNYEKSGMTVKAYCQTNQLKESKFYYHLRRYKEKTIIPCLQPSLLPVSISSCEDQQQNVSVTMFAEVNGIRLYQAVPAEYLLILLNR